MTLKQLIAALLAGLIVATPAFAAELPSGKKAKPPHSDSMKKCSIGGLSGVLAANGVCVHTGGYISATVGAGASTH